MLHGCSAFVMVVCVSSTSPSRFAQIPAHVIDLRVIVLQNAVIVYAVRWMISMLLACCRTASVVIKRFTSLVF